ncbi:A24 family peptidase [uncultured Ornithinimicrobium sp.]|uniref:prepilin peptidase n=1 Tax=uncultured Ornithinimicrobium sp. TaxID=259307 RepID=UPI0025923817|nr:A24 family peptidase [uncultured Ornithinimicrobium sp.]
MTAALLALTGLVVGAALRHLLRDHRYRRADEQDLPPRRRLWLPPAAALTWGAAGSAWWPQSPSYLALVLLASVPLLVLAAIDLDVQRLPDRITLPLAAATAVAVLVVSLLNPDLADPLEIVGSGVATTVVYAVLLFLPGSGMGGGDLKLAPTVGLLTGTLTWVLSALAFFITFAVAGLVGIALMAAGRPRGTLMAFGPYMVLGALAVVAVVPAVSRL